MNGQVCLEEDVSLNSGELKMIGLQPDAPGIFLLRDTCNETAQSDQIRPELSLGAEQQLSLSKLNWNGDHNAKQRMFVHNLIVNIARQYADHEAMLPDLVKQGKQGFIHALEKFEAESDSCFSSYATRCISRYIERALVNRINTPEYFRSTATHVVSFDNPAHRR